MLLRKGEIYMSKKSMFITLGICLVVLFLGMISYSSKILNPFVGIKGLLQIELSDSKVKQISKEPVRYISKDYQSFTDYMESQGHAVEQMGRGFDLQKGSERKIFSSEGFFMTKYYIFTEY